MGEASNGEGTAPGTPSNARLGTGAAGQPKEGPKEGLFPTLQLLYDPRGRPLLDEARPLCRDTRFCSLGSCRVSCPAVGIPRRAGALLTPPMSPQAGERMFSYVVTLNASPIFSKYSAGVVAVGEEKDPAAEGRDDEEDEFVQQGHDAQAMDASEFLAMLRDQRIVPPMGHLPGAAQISHDSAMSCFRNANRCFPLF